jgi:hypothetical protein
MSIQTTPEVYTSPYESRAEWREEVGHGDTTNPDTLWADVIFTDIDVDALLGLDSGTMRAGMRQAFDSDSAMDEFLYEYLIKPVTGNRRSLYTMFENTTTAFSVTIKDRISWVRYHLDQSDNRSKNIVPIVLLGMVFPGYAEDISTWDIATDFDVALAARHTIEGLDIDHVVMVTEQDIDISILMNINSEIMSYENVLIAKS